MKRLVFFGMCLALSLVDALALADKRHLWNLTLGMLSAIVLAGACGLVMRDIRQQHHRDMLTAFDQGRASVMREQIEMARRGQR